ncbi:uncharacterized protein C17orf53 homolog [Scleropages formosus]|uniref:uncharacterized protein C17orf53 homolog n=1 Tax=Scleropages formosus TaxID=113540 RepID=UPI0010FAB813|nr:uncharacterized protein C17orf53 homolog [Scleropages formosus]
MACKWNGLFDVGEDLDEDLLHTDWDVPTKPVPAAVEPISEATFLRAPAQSATNHPILLKASSCTTLKNELGSSSLGTVGGATAGFGLRCMSSAAVSSASPHNSLLPFASGLVDQMEGPVPLSHEPLGSEGHREAGPSPDDFDDWDLDLEELDENALQSQGGILMDRSTPAPPSEDSVSPAKRMRDSLCGGELVPGSNLDGSGPRPAIASPLTRHVFVSSPSLHPGVTSFTVRPLTKAITAGPGTLKPVSPPALQAAAAGLQSVGSLQSSSHMLQPNRFGPPALTPRPLHTPVFTNHLVQLVSAANKTPQKPGTPTLRPKTRRFPGPAGLLPQQQLNGRSLDDIVVPHPQTPAHGAMAQLRSQIPSSQGTSDEFSGGTWAVMKAEMGLDERSPTCFLHSYSIVMVLRKAALKQLAKNKVPNMAVMLKSLLHTHADAKAVFQDPTGEMQGTVHRRLLEERQGELKVGAVLLLKQVGVFSPSHRNHYLNVTPRNLLRIYPPGGTMWSSTQQSFQVPEKQMTRNTQSSLAVGGIVSQMEMIYSNECGERGLTGNDPGAEAQSEAGDSAWDADDLDQLLGELPEESCSL